LTQHVPKQWLVCHGFKLFHSMPKAIRSQLIVKSSNEKFMFGGGEKRDSLGCVTIPVYIMDDEHQAHMIMISVELVDADIDMLMGSSSLDIAEATLELGLSPSLTLSKILGPGTKIPIRKERGHYVFTVFPPTSQDDQEAATLMLDAKEWNVENSNVAIAYILSSPDPNYEAVLHDQVLLSKSFQRKHKLKAETKQEMSKQDFVKLHHYFGHCTADRLEKLVKRANRWLPVYDAYIQEIRDCQICAVEAKRKSLPKTAIPRASNFNQLVTMDLKFNTKFSNKDNSPYILYIIDAFTRFKVATFISDKNSSTIIDAFLTNWIRIFGRPSNVHFDRGTEFNNSEMQTLCDKYDIKITMTAAYSANQNGLNEKNHHYVDFMMTKIIAADPSCSPDTALTWAIHTSNVLENRFGVSPSMLVFGRNIMAHPDLCPTAPSSLESNIDVSKKIQSHLNAISKAREAFMAAESDKTIADALKSRLYQRYEDLEIGQWIYWRNFETNKWQGPSKIVMIDNKNVMTIRNNKLISVNKDHVVLRRSEFENTEPLLTLPPLPSDSNEHSAENIEINLK